MFVEVFEQLWPKETRYMSHDPAQLGFFCTWKDCTNIADFSDVTFAPRTQRHDFPIPGFYIKANGRFCKKHCDEMREYVYEVRAWLPQRKT